MSEHVVPVRTYLIVFAALLVLTFATVAASTVNLGDLVVASAFVWLAILIVITLADYLTRGWQLGRPV